MEAEVYGGRPAQEPPAPTGFSHHSTVATSPHAQQPQKEGSRRKKHKGGGGHGSSSTSNGGGWSLADPETQRKRRVASYKAYAVEGKMKGSLRKSLRWIKDRCSRLVHGW